MDLSKHTEDDLIDMKSEIQKELDRRRKEPTKTVYVTRLDDSRNGATYYKKYNEAEEGFKADIHFTVFEMGNKWSLEPWEIPESEYNNRPDIWFG